MTITEHHHWYDHDHHYHHYSSHDWLMKLKGIFQVEHMSIFLDSKDAVFFVHQPCSLILFKPIHPVFVPFLPLLLVRNQIWFPIWERFPNKPVFFYGHYHKGKLVSLLFKKSFCWSIVSFVVDNVEENCVNYFPHLPLRETKFGLILITFQGIDWHSSKWERFSLYLETKYSGAFKDMLKRIEPIIFLTFPSERGADGKIMPLHRSRHECLIMSQMRNAEMHPEWILCSMLYECVLHLFLIYLKSFETSDILGTTRFNIILICGYKFCENLTIIQLLLWGCL